MGRAPLSSTPDGGPLVELRRASKSFREGERERPVFADVDLELRRAEFVVLTGRSGSGKSTLLNLISGIDLCSSGQVLLLGRDLARVGEPERTLMRRRHVGFVFQLFNLIPTLTVEENLRLPLELCGRDDATGRERALGLLERVGLADRRRSYPDRLSGGEEQRVAVARALVHDPELVLADEPTGNLDDESAEAVLGLLEELLRPERKTLVLVTHSQQAARLADRRLEVHDGHLIEPGGPSTARDAG